MSDRSKLLRDVEAMKEALAVSDAEACGPCIMWATIAVAEELGLPYEVVDGIAVIEINGGDNGKT
jgi:hypothetical protein